jgi:hypothetical protein
MTKYSCELYILSNFKENYFVHFGDIEEYKIESIEEAFEAVKKPVPNIKDEREGCYEVRAYMEDQDGRHMIAKRRFILELGERTVFIEE